MPFVLCGAAMSFQCLTDKTLQGLQDCAVAYIDDILIFNNTWKDHLPHLCHVLTALQRAGVVDNQKKGFLGHNLVQYLRINIGGGKVWAMQDKVEALAKAASPTTQKELQSFLGLANYYWCFVPGFMMKAAPLMDMLKGSGKGMKKIS